MKAGRILVVAPHPDDEILGVGGTLARARTESDETFVVVVTRGYAPEFDEALIARGRAEMARAHDLLGVRETFSLDFPAAGLDTVPHREVNAALTRVVRDVRPARLFVPFATDLHMDHRLAFESALVAARPSTGWTPDEVYAYETLSETNWNAPLLGAAFQPNVFVDISAHIDVKIAAMAEFVSQLREFPHERSLETLRALATLRGSTIGVRAAEAFVLIRELVPAAASTQSIRTGRNRRGAAAQSSRASNSA